jgi:eight-cysteine-cluster-containing protein
MAVFLLAVVAVGLTPGCQKSEQAPARAAEPSAPITVDAPATAHEPGNDGLSSGNKPSSRSPAELYADCKDRVEGEDKPGECQSDSDCQKSGCSSELCISTTQAAQGIMSTCEVRPCFEVLSSCGCEAGVCSWSVGG